MRSVPRRRRSRLAGLALVALSATSLAACSSSPSESPSASGNTPDSSGSISVPAGANDLVAASKQESGLIIYGNPPA